MDQENNILITTLKSRNIDNFKKYKNDNRFLIDEKKKFNLENIEKINPKYIFIPHWSWIIEEEIWKNYTCIIFHMTDLPYGRGGSPLQNLIVRGRKETKISAIKIDGGIDTGDIYIKEDLNLSGTANDIFQRASTIIFEKMIPFILNNNPVPYKQEGEKFKFTRRTLKDSQIPDDISLVNFFDYVRMLDGEGYPRAYIEYGDKNIEFYDGKLYDGYIEANVKIYLQNNNTQGKK